MQVMAGSGFDFVRLKGMQEMSDLYREKGDNLYLPEEEADVCITKDDVT